MLPDFTPEGLLPPGDHVLTFDQLRASPLVQGPRDDPGLPWDKKWRGHLVDNLEIMVGQLHAVGISEIYIAGSFVERDRQRPPGDIDGYFLCDFDDFASTDLATRLNALDRHQVWDWQTRIFDPGDPTKPKLRMWQMYHVELFPTWRPPPQETVCNIFDENNCNQTWAQAFRKSRRFEARGIIRIGDSP